MKDGLNYLYVGKYTVLRCPHMLYATKQYWCSNCLSFFLKDPENKIYDALDLNRGVKETFFSISTPFAFLERLTKPGGMKDLIDVLSKWNKGKSGEY